MITFEIKKLITTKYGNILAHVAFTRAGVKGLAGKSFLAWGFVDNAMAVGDTVELTADEFKLLTFEKVELEDGKSCTEFRLA